MRPAPFALAFLVLGAAPLHAQNLVLNGGFDESLIGWETTGDQNMTAEWSADDSNANPQSGSIRITNISSGPGNGVTVTQCVPVNSGQLYTAAGRVRIPSGAGQDIANVARVGLRWYSGPDCTTPIGGSENSSGSPGSFDVWVNQSLERSARPGAHSVEVRALLTKYPAGGSFIADFDDLELTSLSIFQNGFD